MNIGKSVVIKGELNGSEDLTIEGHVEGRIELKDHVLTIGPNGKIKAQVFAKAVIVLGEVNGNVTASEKVDIRDGGSVDGDIISPRVAIAEGAHFRGSVDMQRKGAQPGQAQKAASSSQPEKGSGRDVGFALSLKRRRTSALRVEIFGSARASPKISAHPDRWRSQICSPVVARNTLSRRSVPRMHRCTRPRCSRVSLPA